MKQKSRFLILLLIIALFSGCLDVDTPIQGTSNNGTSYNVTYDSNISALQRNDTYFNGTVFPQSTNFRNDSINDTIIRNYTAHMTAGSFSRDTSLASGTQAITGVGFKPSFVDFIAFVPVTNKTSWGVDDGVNPGVMYFNSGTSVYNGAAGASIGIVTNATYLYTGKVQSFDNDGFTVVWTKTGLPTGTASIIYKAYR